VPKGARKCADFARGVRVSPPTDQIWPCFDFGNCRIRRRHPGARVPSRRPVTPLDETLGEAEARRLEGRWDDALVLLDAALPAARGLGPEQHGRALVAAARVHVDRSTFGGRPDDGAAESVLAELEELAERSGDTSLLAAALDLRGRILHATFLADRSAGEPEGELARFERGLELRDPADKRGIAESLFHVGLVHQVIRDDSARSRPFFEESYALARDVGDDVLASYAIRHLGWTRQEDGDVDGARAAFEESLRLREAAGFVAGIGAAALALAQFEGEQGQVDRARERLADAREIFERLGMSHFGGFADEVEVERELASRA
jgi:tetratricopeptide (TPR) repeat protein